MTASQRRRSGSRDLCRVGTAGRAEEKRRRRVRSIKRSGLWVGFYLEPSASNRKNRFGTTTTYRPNVFSALTKPLGHCAQHNTILSGALSARRSWRREKNLKNISSNIHSCTMYYVLSLYFFHYMVPLLPVPPEETRVFTLTTRNGSFIRILYSTKKRTCNIHVCLCECVF